MMTKNILIVDDSESIREVISQGLEAEGYIVTRGVNGSDGLEKLRMTHNIHLVITDLNMPLMNGIELLTEIRRLEEYKYLPVIILTTESQELKRQEAKAAGATGWITKPFSNQKLIAVVKKILR
jgi:two-component system chemotaxis response regulator CheY